MDTKKNANPPQKDDHKLSEEYQRGWRDAMKHAAYVWLAVLQETRDS